VKPTAHRRLTLPRSFKRHYRIYIVSSDLEKRIFSSYALYAPNKKEPSGKHLIPSCFLDFFIFTAVISKVLPLATEKKEKLFSEVFSSFSPVPNFLLLAMMSPHLGPIGPIWERRLFLSSFFCSAANASEMSFSLCFRLGKT